jgi:hypothetical protein
MSLTAVQRQSEPKATPCFHRVVGKRPARSRTNCCPVPQKIPYSFTLARKIRFRNRIPTAGAWGVRVDNDLKLVVFSGRKKRVLPLSRTAKFTDALSLFSSILHANFKIYL